MALSGSLDTFELPDVLRLLATTSKTGRLRITGDRGSGSVWVDEGQIVTTELTGPTVGETSDEEAVFGMLRFGAGSFTFETDAAPPTSGQPQALEPVLGTAENMLVEWRAIEEVVPSLDVWAVLCPDLGGNDVMLDATRWRSIVAIGSGGEVRVVAEALDVGEIEACRTVKELIELGLVQLSDRLDHLTAAPAAAAEPAPVAEPAPAPMVDDAPVEPVHEEPEAAPTHAVDAFAPADDDAAASWSADDSDPLAPPDTATVPSLASLGSTDADGSDDPLLSSGDPLAQMTNDGPEERLDDLFAAPTAQEVENGDLDPAEMARQLANLSPKAAKAVAAAARASTDAERDAALAAVEAEDDSVNRGLLLKFLGSVDS